MRKFNLLQISAEVSIRVAMKYTPLKMMKGLLRGSERKRPRSAIVRKRSSF